MLYLQVTADGTYFVESAESPLKGIVYTVSDGNVVSTASYSVSAGQKTPDESTRIRYEYDNGIKNLILTLFRIPEIEIDAVDARINSINNLVAIRGPGINKDYSYEYSPNGEVSKVTDLATGEGLQLEFTCR